MNKYINNLFKEQKKFFNTDKTKLLSFRILKLKRFLNEIEKQYENIREALKTDLNKGECEIFISEYLLVVNEIKHAIKHIRQ
jgi:aldehyde dehydrogenase (NAD+)